MRASRLMMNVIIQLSVENQSFWLDFKIMLKTVKKVLAKEDISAEGEATMTKFTGSKHD